LTARRRGDTVPDSQQGVLNLLFPHRAELWIDEAVWRDMKSRWSWRWPWEPGCSWLTGILRRTFSKGAPEDRPGCC